MPHTRFLIALMLLYTPVLASAQESGSGSISSGSGMTLEERLTYLAEGAQDPEAFIMPVTTRNGWTAEVKRYMERSAELRDRCHEEIRKANRDTIAERSAQCLRSDLLLEIGHRRKQQEILAVTPGASLSATAEFDAFIDAAGSVVDGVDAGVFTTVDVLKEAKRNLHETYRLPMLFAITQVRVSVLRGIIPTFARVAQNIADDTTDPEAFRAQIVACLDEAHARRVTASASTTQADATAGFRSTLSAVRTCRTLLEELVLP